MRNMCFFSPIVVSFSINNLRPSIEDFGKKKKKHERLAIQKYYKKVNSANFYSTFLDFCDFWIGFCAFIRD